MLTPTAIVEEVKRAACEAGFEAAGIAPAGDFSELEFFPEWIARGYAGEMRYLTSSDEQGRLRRQSLQSVAPWARSVIVCAMNYNIAAPSSMAPVEAGRGWISRYAWSAEDYHDVLRRGLQQVEARVRELGADQTRCYVDTGPLIERVYAKYAGIGWIGKNTCIIHHKLGSWLFLGVILTSLDLFTGEAAALPEIPAPDRCGTCTRCIEACPTEAIVAPYVLDGSRCISCLTIEKRGDIPETLRDAMGRHVFGCDICQDVCPWNRRAPVSEAEAFQPRPGLVNPSLDWLATIGEEEFRAGFRDSPIRRAKRTGLRRNAVVAMGNSGDERFAPLLKQLAEDEDPVVTEHARWALRKIWRNAAYDNAT